MADFCMGCSLEVFGEDTKDLADLSTETDTKAGKFPVVLCEGCGQIQVDHTGRCVSKRCQRHMEQVWYEYKD